MAGDAISATTQYYYEGATTNNNNSLATNVITSLLAAFNGSAAATAATHGASTTALSSQLNGSGFPAVADPHQYSNDNQRKAYLTVLFFDERFNYVSDGSTYQRVQTAGDNAAPLVLANIKAPKNGYAYVYVSNESDEPVYFDNLQVAHNRGRIVEENHYYAFGLKIAGISSHKLADANEGNTDNKYLYNDKELDDEGDLNWLDYGFRNYDPQIGRFVQIDPLSDDYDFNSPYSYAINNPINYIDVDGLGPGDGLAGMLVYAVNNILLKAPQELAEVTVKSVSHVGKIAKTGTSIATKVGTKVLGEVAFRVVTLTLSHLQQINPDGVKTNLQQQVNYINQYGKELGIDTKKKMAHFLSQTGHESGGGHTMTESYSYGMDVLTGKRFVDGITNHFTGLSTATLKRYARTPKVLDRAYAGPRIEGNGDEASGDGSRYRGRGLLQLTGKENYRKFTKWYQSYFNDYTMDFVKNPELLAENVRIAVLSGLWDFFINLNLGKLADTDNVDKISKRVNGGSNGITERRKKFEAAKKALGIP